jgi:hypothetical protein
MRGTRPSIDRSTGLRILVRLSTGRIRRSFKDLRNTRDVSCDVTQSSLMLANHRARNITVGRATSQFHNWLHLKQLSVLAPPETSHPNSRGQIKTERLRANALEISHLVDYDNVVGLPMSVLD